MPTINVVVDSPLPPEIVLEAAHDFSQRRTEVFPAVVSEHFVLNGVAGTSADVTEGTGTGIGINWERCRYDWSHADSVTADVTDSNVYADGSSWKITVTPRPSGGSRIEMSWGRRFKRTPRGLLFGTAFRTVGRPLFRKYGRQVVHNLESLEHRAERPS
jgi:hypothetical protein